MKCVVFFISHHLCRSMTQTKFMEKRGLFSHFYLIYLCIRGIDFASFYDFDIWFWNCFDIVSFSGFHFTESQKMIFVSCQKNVLVHTGLYHSLQNSYISPWNHNGLFKWARINVYIVLLFTYKTFFISIIYLYFYNASLQHEQWW